MSTKTSERSRFHLFVNIVYSICVITGSVLFASKIVALENQSGAWLFAIPLGIISFICALIKGNTIMMLPSIALMSSFTILWTIGLFL